MELNIQAIADTKITAMHESGQIKERIEKDIEDTVLKAIDSAIDGYAMRRDIETQVSDSVSKVVSDIGFSAYNGFIASAVKRITEEVMLEDVAQKIQSAFNDILIAKHDGIMLSDIFNQYREWVCENTDESDKWERRNFVCDMEEKKDGSFTYYRIKFNDEELSRCDTPQIEFSICQYLDNPGSIAWLRLDGKTSEGSFCLGSMDKMQSLLANLYFNKTTIVIDADDINDDSGYDIDC